MTLEIKSGVIGGTVFSVVGSIGGDIIRTMILAAIGATVSYFVSAWWKKRREQRHKK